MAYVLQATTQDGAPVYYTGRAGEGWVSRELQEAFALSSELGDRRLASFNRMAPLHGLTFQKVRRK
jgi:hypothetical protein